MNKLDTIASIVSGKTMIPFQLLMEDEDFYKLAINVKNLSIDEAVNKLVNKANEIS